MSADTLSAKPMAIGPDSHFWDAPNPRAGGYRARQERTQCVTDQNDRGQQHDP
jgi:hypothetical protein